MKEKMSMIEIPSGIVQFPPVEHFHDGMSLTWDQVTEIYEDEERGYHYVAFDSSEHSPKEMFQKMLELGIMNFGFHTILKAKHIFLLYVPGGIKTTEEQIIPIWKREAEKRSSIEWAIPI